MKKMAGRILSFLMVWNLGAGLGLAADNQAFINNVYQETEDQVEIICTIPGETDSADQVQVLLGDQMLSIHDVARAGQEKLPMTVYCLVDVSGSMKGRMDQAKEVLSAINSGLSEQDSLVIGKMGNQITDSGFLNTREEGKAEIDSLAYTGEDTDLYSGIIHGLRFLRQEPGVHSMRALVVISDGCDDQGDGSTWREAYEMVSQSHIPVYTAALVLSAADYEQAKELGSFARSSAGGVHLPKSDDSGSKPISMTGEEMGQETLNCLGETLRIRADLTGIRKTEKDTCRLTVIYKNQAGRSYEDSFEIQTRNLRLREDAPEETDEKQTQHIVESSEEDPLDPKPSEEEDKNAWHFPAIAGAAAALALILCAVGVIGAKRKQEEKKRREEERLCQEEEKKRQEEKQRQEQQERERQEQARRQQAQEEEKRRQQEMEKQRAREEAFRSLPRLSVRLAAIGQQNKTCVVELVKGYEMTAGRNGNAQIILDSRDTKLSGVHFVMLWDGKSVYVWDMQSKNGTSVNGVVINHLGRVAVRPGDSLRAGSYEYRLYWED